jgi:hypothetical protein
MYLVVMSNEVKCRGYLVDCSVASFNAKPGTVLQYRQVTFEACITQGRTPLESSRIHRVLSASPFVNIDTDTVLY